MRNVKLTARQTALAIFALTCIIYQFPLVYDLAYKPFFNWTPAQDVASTSLLPLAILEHGDFILDEYRSFYEQNFTNMYFVADVNGKLVSRSPVAAAVLALPFYGLTTGSGWIASPQSTWLAFPWTAFLVAKFAAALITALAALMFFFCARELADLRTSALLTLCFAFGTSVWSTATQSLWQQTPSLLFQLIGIWFLLRGHRRGPLSVAAGAFSFSAATIARPNNGLTALLFTLYVFLEFRSAFWRWILWAIPPAIFFFAYNAVYNGSPLVFGYQDGIVQYIGLPRWDALLGLFFSPSRGLFVYSPFLILGLYGTWMARDERNAMFYQFSALAFMLCVLVLSVWEYWDGGWGYGTRMLTDVLPYAALLLIPAFLRLDRVGGTAFWVAVGYSVVLQSLGLWDYGVRWHWHWTNYAYNVWDLAENEPGFYVTQYIAMVRGFVSARLLR